MLRTEADYRSGLKDLASGDCASALERVRRNPADAVLKPGEVNEIWVSPINAARQSTYGVDIAGRYQWRLGQAGQLGLSARYTRVLNYVNQANAKDKAVNQVGTRSFSGWPERLTTSLNWTIGSWSSTLTANLNGRIPASADGSWIDPTWLFNASASVQTGPHTKVGLIINNLTGASPKDPGSAWPYYPVGYYLPHGRQFWLEVSHRF